jgi:hypothetical protein
MLAGPPAEAAPGGHTQADVHASVVAAVAYIDTQQNVNGSFGVVFPVAETGAALLAYGVLANGNFASLSAAYQLHVKNAITWLLSQQNLAAPSIGGVGGSWSGDDGYTYDTSLAISGLSTFTAVNLAIPAAVSNGRAFLINEFQAPPFVACSSTDPPDATASFCGGWNYTPSPGRSDESNTGFALTGLRLSGGVPPAIAAVNVGWQHHVQQIATNTFATRNDGGGSYQPGIGGGPFSSNANDSGSMLFGLGFDGAPIGDPRVQAALKFGNDILDVYELAAPANHIMVYHTGAAEDGACSPGVGTCDWSFAPGEGGYHYSLFALSKGLGEYIPPSLFNPANWYAKEVDLLLNQQLGNGSWPVDLRDDGSVVFTAGLSVAVLGLVGVAQPKPTGIVKVCKVAGPGVNPGSVFAFTVGSTKLNVPAGSCVIGPSFPVGLNVPVSETLSASSGITVGDISVAPPSRLVGVPNLATHSVTIKVGTGVTVVTVTNKRTGFLEICKLAGGPGVQGSYTFNVSPGALGPFIVPVGACSFPIEVAAGTVSISETFSASTRLTACSTFPATRQKACDLAAQSSTVAVAAGDVSTETIAYFTNSRLPKKT